MSPPSAVEAGDYYFNPALLPHALGNEISLLRDLQFGTQ